MADKVDPEAAVIDDVDEGSSEGDEEEEEEDDDVAEDAKSNEIIIDSPADAPSKKTVWIRRGILIGVAAFVVVVIIIAVSIGGKDKGSGTPVDDSIVRFDCHPDQEEDDGTIQKNCQDRGCNWNAGGTPKCAYPEDYTNYVVITVSPISDQDRILIKLNKTDRPSGFTKDIQSVTVDVTGIDDDVVRVKVYDDTDEGRWQVPLPVLNLKRRHQPNNPKYNISVEGNDLKITRIETGAVLFHTNLPQLIFSDQFLQLTVNVVSNKLYGLGERQAPHEKSLTGLQPNERKVFTFLNHDGVVGKSSYGSHPFYLMYESNNKDQAHGVLLLNSNAMDITFTTTPALTYRTIGGVFDFLIFAGPTAAHVLQQKARVIGNSPMPPYWSLGFHLCRYGYKNTSEVREAFTNNTALGIPVDTQWVDIDYMENKRDFTLDPKNFGDLPEFVVHLHENNRRFIPILDPSIGYNDTHPTEEYTSGIASDIFIKNDARDLLVTRVWNPLSVIPDFTHPAAGDWWKQALERFHDKAPFDGIWIDMNEPAAVSYFGSIDGCTNKSLDEPQYNPYHPLPVWHHSICFSGRQYVSRHYDVHNLFGLYEGKVTYEALTSIPALANKRPFILSRATTTGQGSYTSHWLGDVDSSWEHLRSSIPSILDFNLFGMPMVGSDICGFNRDTTDELCSRWTSLGSFYTFVRNHNSKESSNQDPASMKLNVQEAARKSLNTRYTFLPHLYTLFYHNTISGAPVLRSLKFNFPEDEATNSNDRQFMWGEGLLVNAVLEKGETSVNAYFPAGVWYDYPGGHVLSEGQAKNVTLDVPLTDINIALRGGRIFPTIPSVNSTTHDHKSLPFRILAALDEEELATGDLYWDDGEQLNAATTKDAHSYIHFQVKHSSLRVHVLNSGSNDFPNEVNEVVVLGVKREVKKVILKPPQDAAIVLTHNYVNGRLTAELPSTKILSDFSIKWTY